jgi:ligand-binding SRPBCC domain-containing protein
MKIYTLEREQVVDKPLDEVFDFFSKSENLARITPSDMGFNILTPSPIDMRTGTVIDYTIKISGFSIHWRTLISSYDPPYSFTDEQLRGPYSFWHHRHRFEKTDNGTRIHDKVIYALPFGLLGRLAHSLFVKRQLKNIFDYRSLIIKRIFNNE